jgi:hypothetical protein
VFANSVDYISDAVCVPENALKRLPDFRQVGGLLIQEVQSCAGIVARCVYRKPHSIEEEGESRKLIG